MTMGRADRFYVSYGERYREVAWRVFDRDLSVLCGFAIPVFEAPARKDAMSERNRLNDAEGWYASAAVTP